MNCVSATFRNFLTKIRGQLQFSSVSLSLRKQTNKAATKFLTSKFVSLISFTVCVFVFLSDTVSNLVTLHPAVAEAAIWLKAAKSAKFQRGCFQYITVVWSHTVKAHIWEWYLQQWCHQLQWQRGLRTFLKGSFSDPFRKSDRKRTFLLKHYVLPFCLYM